MKLDLKLAEKDKRLLLTALIVFIFIAAFFGFKTIDGKVTEMEEEKQKLMDIRKDLQVKDRHREEYTFKAMAYKALYEDIIGRYATGLDQETLIMDLVDIEESVVSEEDRIEAGDLWIKQAGFTEIGTLYTFGNVTSTNPAANPGDKVYSTDLVGLSTNTNISYQCTYDALKALLNRINNYETKYKISTISVSYNDSEELVTGSIALSSFAITGENRIFPGTTVDGVGMGTENIFKSNTHTSNPIDSSYIDRMKNDYDMYVLLNSSASDMESIVIGKRMDALGRDRISVNSNAAENVTIKVSGSNGSYTVAYAVKDEEFPSTYPEGGELIVGETLDLLIMSSKRIDQDDTSTAKIKIINETDMVLNVGVIGDDVASPRCIITETQGDVEKYYQ